MNVSNYQKGMCFIVPIGNSNQQAAKFFKKKYIAYIHPVEFLGKYGFISIICKPYRRFVKVKSKKKMD